MQFKDIEVRERQRDGERVVEVDGYNQVGPESKAPEYRRVALLDLSEAQARELHARLGDLLEAWEEE